MQLFLYSLLKRNNSFHQFTSFFFLVFSNLLFITKQLNDDFSIYDEYFSKNIIVYNKFTSLLTQWCKYFE